MANTLLKGAADALGVEFGVATLTSAFGSANCQVLSGSYQRAPGSRKEMMGDKEELRMLLLANPSHKLSLKLLISSADFYTNNFVSSPQSAHTTGQLPRFTIGSAITIPGLNLAASILDIKVDYDQGEWVAVDVEAERWDSMGTPSVTVL